MIQGWLAQATGPSGVGSAAAAAVVAVATEPNLGFTVSALILALGGAGGAWARAAISGTQAAGWPWQWNSRMWADAAIGMAFGVLLPAFGTVLKPIFGFDLTQMTAVQQGGIALMCGGGGSWFFTAIGWKTGYIVPASTPQTNPEDPKMGVLKKRDANTQGEE